MLWAPRRRLVMVGGGRSLAGNTPPPVPTLAAHDPGWTPAQPDIDNLNAITLGVNFTAAGSIGLGGVAWFAPATIGGTYTAAIWQATTPTTGNVAGQLNFTAGDVTAGQWNYLAVPVTVAADLVWTAGVWTSTGHYVRTAPAGPGEPYNAGSLTGNGITLLADGSDPNPPGLGGSRNGVFSDDPGGAGIAYPSTMFGQADYGIDVWM